jgi:hypothetical protein
MTLLLAAATPQHAVLVADRRTSTASGVHSEETGKLGVALLDDARVGIAYAGLAEFGRFKMRSWLPETLASIRSKQTTLAPVIEELRLAAEVVVAGLRGLPVDDSRLTLLIAGYQYGAQGAVPAFARISNFEVERFEAANSGSRAVPIGIRTPTHEFTVAWDLAPAGFTVGAGYGEALTWGQMEELRAHIKAGVTASALRAKMVHLARTVGAHPASQGLIGAQLSSLVLPVDPGQSVEMDYHTAVRTRSLHLPASYDLRSSGKGGGAMIWDASITYGSAGDPPVLVPRVGGKRKCPCGSGKQYRRCHGRRSGPRMRIQLGGSN